MRKSMFDLSHFPYFLQNITSTIATVPAVLDDAKASGVLWQAAPGRFLLNLPGIARYLVEDGVRVTVEPTGSASLDSISRFGMMAPFAALVYQRGALALHAAAVANEHGAILLAGDSGSGKSALLFALLQRGWTLLADEVAVLTMDSEGAPVVHGTSRELVLWSDTLENFGRDTDGLERADSNRLIVTQLPQCPAVPKPVRAIYRLGIQSKVGIARENLSGVEMFRMVGMVLYNSHVAAALLDRGVYMRYVASLASSATVSRLYRPRGYWSVNDLADFIEKELQ